MNALTTISSWKLDAKQEQVERYFFHPSHIDGLLEGDKNYVIGRKGTGKTAVSEYIFRTQKHDHFSTKLTFKNFPFNELYRLENSDYTRPNQYISLWKYLVYGSICRMMVQNSNIDSSVRDVLEKIYGSTDPILNLKRTVKRWTAKEVGLTISGLGGKVALEEGGQSWLDRIDVLEDVISQYIDDAEYYILFDELDEDYKNIVDVGSQSDYLALITSLFKAIQDVRGLFIQSGKNVRPIVFLRDDIYDLILDADKNKWEDFRIDLDWDKIRIMPLLAFRINRSIASDGELLDFDDAWHQVVSRQGVGIGTRARRKIPIFDYISRSTQLRPRDYVRYLQVAATEAINQGQGKISPGIAKKVDKGFSNYLRNELIDEIHGILPDIQDIFSIISEIRKQVLTIKEFRQIYNKRLKAGVVTTSDPDFVLKILFHFSVVGNTPRVGVSFFRYNNKEARFNFSENIIVHRGLFKSLQII